MAEKTDTRTKLLTASPFQLMLSLSIPAIIGMVVVGLYSFMDRVFVGQLIDEIAMGAVSVAYPPLTDLVVIILTTIMLVSEFNDLSKLAKQEK